MPSFLIPPLSANDVTAWSYEPYCVESCPCQVRVGSSVRKLTPPPIEPGPPPSTDAPVERSAAICCSCGAAPPSSGVPPADAIVWDGSALRSEIVSVPLAGDWSIATPAILASACERSSDTRRSGLPSSMSALVVVADE
jgi:hypothetical protein